MSTTTTKISDPRVAERARRWESFYEGAGPQHLILIGYKPDALDRPHPNPDNIPERIEWAWTMYGRMMDRLEWLDDDRIPYLDVFTGTEIFAEAFGCRVHRPEDSNPFALPKVRKAADVARLKVPELSRSPLAKLFDIADALLERAGGGAVLKIVDLQSPMDIAALVWDKNDLFVAMIEEPGAVRDLSAMTRELLVTFLDEWFARYGRSFVAHYPDYFMPWGVTLSVDEVGAVSEAMFEEFFAEELRAMSGRYGRMGIHCCAHAQHQWGNFLRVPNLCLMNLVAQPEVLRESWRVFRDVPQMPTWYGDGDPAAWTRHYPEGSRFVLRAPAESRQEAIDLARRMRRGG